MRSHEEVCPLEYIACTFAEAGCTKFTNREDSPKHLRENIEAHLSLMMAAHLKLKKEVQRMNEGRTNVSGTESTYA